MRLIDLANHSLKRCNLMLIQDINLFSKLFYSDEFLSFSLSYTLLYLKNNFFTDFLNQFTDLWFWVYDYRLSFGV